MFADNSLFYCLIKLKGQSNNKVLVKLYNPAFNWVMRPRMTKIEQQFFNSVTTKSD